MTMGSEKKGSGGVSPPNVKRNALRASVGRDAPPPLVFANPFLPVETHANHLPHWQQREAAQFVTWRLKDSLPRERLEQWKQEKDAWRLAHPKPWDDPITDEYHRLFGDRMEEWLDAGAGACILRDPDVRRIMENALRYFDGKRYDLWAFVVMPNHVHTLFSPHPPHPLEQTLHSWKSFTAKAINHHLGESGPVWQEDYWDRLVRSEAHYDRCVRYIRENAEKARLTSDEYALYVNEGSNVE